MSGFVRAKKSNTGLMNPKYEAAFKAGYEQGKYSALQGSAAKKIMQSDMISIYGHLCLCLHKRGWKTETIESLMTSIQQSWVDYCEYVAECKRDGKKIEKIEDIVAKTTGVNMVQQVDDVMNIEVDV